MKIGTRRVENGLAWDQLHVVTVWIFRQRCSLFSPWTRYLKLSGMFSALYISFSSPLGQWTSPGWGTREGGGGSMSASWGCAGAGGGVRSICVHVVGWVDCSGRGGCCWWHVCLIGHHLVSKLQWGVSHMVGSSV